MRPTSLPLTLRSVPGCPRQNPQTTHTTSQSPNDERAHCVRARSRQSSVARSSARTLTLIVSCSFFRLVNGGHQATHSGGRAEHRITGNSAIAESRLEDKSPTSLFTSMAVRLSTRCSKDILTAQCFEFISWMPFSPFKMDEHGTKRTKTIQLLSYMGKTDY